MYRCRYCGFKTTSSSGLSSHISQSPSCLDQIVAANQPATHPQKRPHSESPAPGLRSTPDNQFSETLLYSSLLGDQPSTKRTRVEDVEDDPIEIKMDIVYKDFEPPAGEPRQPKPANVHSHFERLREEQISTGQQPWAPFSSVEDWDYARWITESDLSQRGIDDMLKLDIVGKHFPSEGCKCHDSLKIS